MHKLNNDKTEFMQFPLSIAPNKPVDPDPVMPIVTDEVSTGPHAENLGIVFNSEPH